MAEIIQNEGGGKKGGKRRPKKGVAHVDMTPMVDLFMLLLTFFMLTTAFSKPKVMELVLPDKDKPKEAPKVEKSRTVNIILDEKDKVYWYNGMIAPGEPTPEMHVTDFSKNGIRQMLLHRNKDLFQKIQALDDDILRGKKVLPKDTIESIKKHLRKEDKEGPVVLIKATDLAKYGNMVDVIDEMAIANISRYAIVDMSAAEKKLLDSYKQTLK
jgi:biopolymer transport protein ExbD